MRETSNPVFRSLPRQQGGYAQFGTGAAQLQQDYYRGGYGEAPYREAKATRPLRSSWSGSMTDGTSPGLW